MSLMDVLLLTLTSGIICVALPKLISLICPGQTNHNKLVDRGLKPLEVKQSITIFPYCTSYIFTENSSCKFSPNFCIQCYRH